MMRSLLCVGAPRDDGIDFPEDGHGTHHHHHGHNSRDFAPTSAAGRMRTAGRRLSLQISSKLGGRSSTEAASGDESVGGAGTGAGAGAGAKVRRNSKHTSLGAISKKSIGHPEGFKHEQHVGFPGVVSCDEYFISSTTIYRGGADIVDIDR
jgi:hypothetical protein